MNWIKMFDRTVCDESLPFIRNFIVIDPVKLYFKELNSLFFRINQNESFDFAFATESLEHAVEIETAISELSRVVKPGGKIVVIDKNREHWGRLETPEWERWFTPKELSRLLSRHCREVEARPISYWEDVAPDGLFYAWLARK